MSPTAGPTPRLFSRSRSEMRRIGEILRRETVGGALLLVATVVALAWANSHPNDLAFTASLAIPLAWYVAECATSAPGPGS